MNDNNDNVIVTVASTMKMNQLNELIVNENYCENDDYDNGEDDDDDEYDVNDNDDEGVDGDMTVNGDDNVLKLTNGFGHVNGGGNDRLVELDEDEEYICEYPTDEDGGGGFEDARSGGERTGDGQILHGGGHDIVKKEILKCNGGDGIISNLFVGWYCTISFYEFYIDSIMR